MPTIPDPASIIRKRYRMRRTLRFAGLVLSMIFLISVLVDALDALLSGRAWHRVAWNALPAAGFLVGAIVLVVLESPLVRWLVPIPRPGCPLCGHPSLPERGARCSECGQTLPAELLAREPEA